jgi:hypothetical protein
MDRSDAPPVRPRPMAAALPIGTDPASVRQRIEAMERLLERGFTVPGTRYQFGLDALVGLIPVVGDFVGAALGAYLVWEAKNLGLPKWKLWRMAGNVGFDTAVGLVPFAGDALDFLFRSNTRNLRILKRHLDKHHPETRVIEG